MTLITGLFMGLMNAFIELRIVRASPFLTKLFSSNTVYGMAFSLLLAVVVGGWIFAANGIVIMLSWMVSTVTTQGVHEARAAVDKRPLLAEQVNAWKSIAKFIFFPLYIVRWIFRLPYNIQKTFSKA